MIMPGAGAPVVGALGWLGTLGVDRKMDVGEARMDRCLRRGSDTAFAKLKRDVRDTL